MTLSGTGFNIVFPAEVAQVVEHGTENAGVDSSSLSLGTFFERKWLSGRASPCQGEGREFESPLPLQLNWGQYMKFYSSTNVYPVPYLYSIPKTLAPLPTHTPLPPPTPDGEHSLEEANDPGVQPTPNPATGGSDCDWIDGRWKNCVQR